MPQEQAESKTLEEEPQEKVTDVLVQLLDQAEKTYRRVAVDAYAAQQSSARNYLWLASLILTVSAGLFDWTGAGNALIADQIGLWTALSLSALGFAFVLAFAAFALSVKVCWGSQRIEFLPQPASAFEMMAAEGFRKGFAGSFRRTQLAEAEAAIQLAGAQMNRRGKMLRFVGQIIFAASVGTFFAVLLYAASFCFQS